MKQTQHKELSRRDALKLAAVGSAAMVIGSPEAKASATGPKKKPSKKSPLRIVIIGGGMAGTTLAYRLRRAITWPKITVFEPLRNSAWYQPGLTMLGTGACCERGLEYKRSDYIPDGVKWVEASVVSIDTEAKKVKDSKGDETPYDYLIIASGARLDFSAIEGLEGEIASLQILEEKAVWMDDPAVGSIYYLHGAQQLYEQFASIVQKAVETKEKKLSVLFTQPDVGIKSPGAAKSALNTLLEKLESEKVRERVDIVVSSGDGKLSACEAYDKIYKKELEKQGVTFKTARLSKVDRETKTATFDDGSTETYDFLHIAPPMRTEKLFDESGLSNADGWIDVKPDTLQHKRHETIFAVGDAAGIGVLKTGAAIVEQVKMIVDTIRAIDEGRKPDAIYEGYGCDTILCTGEKRVRYEAWDREKKPLALFSFVDPLTCHSIYWYLNKRLIKPYVMAAVLRGWA
jgi:sulfide:quinone oxidoreductase